MWCVDQCCQHARALALLTVLLHYRPSTPDRYLCAEEEMRDSWESLAHNNSVYEYINSEIQRKREYTIVRGIIDQVCRLAVSPAGGYWAGRRRVRAAKNGRRQSAAGLRTGYTSRVPRPPDARPLHSHASWVRFAFLEVFLYPPLSSPRVLQQATMILLAQRCPGEG